MTKKYFVFFLAVFVWISSVIYLLSQINISSIQTTIRFFALKKDQQQELFLVKRVLDGDTLELENGQKVRYIGINTPETSDPRKKIECFGQKAKEENKRLVEGKKIKLIADISETDRYHRLLRYVFVDNVFVNDYLVRNGFAQTATFPPDVKFQKQFQLAENEARINSRGLWKECRR